MKVVSAILVNNNCMNRCFIFFIVLICSIYACGPSRRIQTAIARKDSVAVTETIPSDRARKDSILTIQNTFDRITKNRIRFTTFSAKVDIEYEDAEGKKYDVNAHLRMYTDSVIWISVTAILGIEGV